MHRSLLILLDKEMTWLAPLDGNSRLNPCGFSSEGDTSAEVV